MFRLSSGSKRSAAIGPILLVMAFFVACSDDDSSFATRPSDGSSSSVCEDCDDGSSSSAKSKSSDSETSVSTGSMTDSRDGQTYKTMTIGTQTWMAENLNYKTDSSFCYNNVESNCAKYGRLYTWAAAVGKLESECGYGKTCSLPSGNIRGVCPSGWHLPSNAEWNTLFTAVGGQSTAGRVLKSTSGWYDNGNGTDSFGFSALPAGYRYDDMYYNLEGGLALFWSSSENISFSAYYMGLDFNHDGAGLNHDRKNSRFSVRCLKD